jgi:hypothetical protein
MVSVWRRSGRIGWWVWVLTFGCTKAEAARREGRSEEEGNREQETGILRA